MTDRFATERDYALCQQIHRKFGTTYYLSSLRFPPEHRRRVHAIYAFVRVPDEWVDNPGALSLEQRQQHLHDWRNALRDSLRGVQPEHPVMRAFCDVVRESQMPISEAEKFLDAMEMDLYVTRYRTYHQLREYMRGSASAVGIMMCYAMGSQINEDVLSRAEALGEAMQLTNFLRDISEDLERGRIYLPLDELALFGLQESDLLARKVTPDFRAFMQFEIQRARDLYHFAEPGIYHLPHAMQNAVMMARILYSQILDAIERNDYDVFTRRARTTVWQKARAIVRTYGRRGHEPVVGTCGGGQCNRMES